MQRNLFETIAYMVDQMLKHKIKNAKFDKSYSGIISDILFEPDTPRDSSKFGTYKIRFGVVEKVVKLNDDFVHEIGERVNVTICENNPNRIIVKPVVQRIAPYKITYDSNEGKYIEHRRVKTAGKTYETINEYKIVQKESDDDGQEVTEMILPNGQTIKFKGWNI